jgi:hypothetical protein
MQHEVYYPGHKNKPLEEPVVSHVKPSHIPPPHHLTAIYA